MACGAPVESMHETVRNFKGVEHRIEFVAELDGVKFYNDSKATSVDATSKALEALSGGGVSTFFSRPSWQVGTGVPSGTKRCVPDVASMAASGMLTIVNGAQIGGGGTSMGPGCQ